jgi:hypothetical protein
MAAAAKNMRLLAQDRLREHGSIGEGMALQRARDGRRILWLAHEHAPRNFTGVDVSDPKKPRVIVQTDLAHNEMRSNSLDITGEMMAVAYQTNEAGAKPAGIELFDISTPETPKSISFFDCSGEMSRGVHQLWFVDGEFIHCASGAPDFRPKVRNDHLIYRIIDVRNPAKPVEAGRWWYPGQREGDAEEMPPRLPKFGPQPGGIRAHNTNVYPDHPDRAYVGYFDGGAFVLDITDKARPRVVSHWNPAPPYHGLTHTVLPLFGRDLFVVTEEAVVDGALDWPKLTWVVDARNKDNLVPVATLPLPPVEAFRNRGRYGSHNLHENRPGPLSFQSERFVFGTFFSGGVRVFDLKNPLRPEEVAFYVPGPPAGSKVGVAQLNDVFVDENGIVYTVDRYTGGLYILETNF